MTALDTGSYRARTLVDTPGVAGAAFKEALARLASGLAIVSCWGDGGPEGVLVSSITGLSVDPPRFLFCIRREASAHDTIAAAHVCGVSILSADDEAEARTFMDPAGRADRFTGAGWTREALRPPLLQTALSTAVCLVDTIIEAGSHSIVLVTAQSLAQRPARPLVSYDRALHLLPG